MAYLGASRSISRTQLISPQPICASNSCASPANDSATVATNVIAPIATTTALSTSSNPATYGQNVNLTAAVAAGGGSSVPAGTVVALLGASGSGKTALLRAVAGLETSCQWLPVETRSRT